MINHCTCSGVGGVVVRAPMPNLAAAFSSSAAPIPSGGEAATRLAHISTRSDVSGSNSHVGHTLMSRLMTKGAHLSSALGGRSQSDGGQVFLVGRIFLARGEYFWLGGTLATFGAVFPRAPYRITCWQRGFGGNPRQKCAAGENWRK